MNPELIVQEYFNRHLRVVMWPEKGAQKGPTEKNWQNKLFTIDDYKPQTRVGLICGQEVEPERFLHDVDIDWSEGYKLALPFLPKTGFIYGRKSKHISHCFYTLSETLPRIVFTDPTDKKTLLEIRGTTSNGDLGLQTMVPPSVWSDGNGNKEILEFRGISEAVGVPHHFGNVAVFKYRVTLAAITMLLGKHLGNWAFGHDIRLAWAGFLLRLQVSVDDLLLMGEALSKHCDNTDVSDVKKVIDSTAANLADGKRNVRGGPALIRLLGDNGGKIVEQISAWLGHEQDFIRDQNGAIKPNRQENIRRALRLMELEFSYNAFSETPLFRKKGEPWRPIDDRKVNNIRMDVDANFRFMASKDFFRDVIADLADKSMFHPVKEYLEPLNWDGIPRIDFWLRDYGGAEDTQDSSESRTYLEAVSSIVLIAAVRRVMEPGCIFQEMLVLESPQGLNKSTALKALCPNDEWFSEDFPLNSRSKELIEGTSGKWIVEASEMTGRSKADNAHVKSMLSRSTDGPVRLAFDRYPTERKRQFIVIGTTNDKWYLNDPTGNRRYWPVRVKRFNIEGIKKDRDQLWAEAVVRERNGESIRLPEELWEVAAAHQEARRQTDAWEEVLYAMVLTLTTEYKHRRVSAEMVYAHLGVPKDRRDYKAAGRITTIMDRLGFRRKNIRISQEEIDGFRVPLNFKEGLVSGVVPGFEEVCRVEDSEIKELVAPEDIRRRDHHKKVAIPKKEEDM